jgi:CBS domain-containing protein
MENTLIKDCMTTQVATTSPTVSITKALRILLDNKQSAAPVITEDGKLAGLISEADCMKSALNRSIYPDSDSTVSDQMTTEVQTVTPETKLTQAAEIFLNHKRRMLPVVEDGKLVGIVTRHHILRALIDIIDTPKFK